MYLFDIGQRPRKAGGLRGLHSISTLVESPPFFQIITRSGKRQNSATCVFAGWRLILAGAAGWPWPSSADGSRVALPTATPVIPPPGVCGSSVGRASSDLDFVSRAQPPHCDDARLPMHMRRTEGRLLCARDRHTSPISVASVAADACSRCSAQMCSCRSCRLLSANAALSGSIFSPQ